MANNSALLTEALAAASDTKLLHIECGALSQAAMAFRSQFGSASAILIADPVTFDVAGKQVVDSMRRGGVDVMEPILLTDTELHAEWKHIDHLDAALSNTDATPVAVGSGTINDLTKLASHRAGRMYMAVPTAASMDGYTAFGASITKDGSKQTFSCPAPRAVVADLDVICNAPPEMTASGYADLMAKVTAGADWLVADALGVEPIDTFSWKLVQEPLHNWLADPESIGNGDPDAIGRLVEGLMMGGFAMQHLQSSRPASGAEHQFSHLWDMQHHTHNGVAPSHGFKVGIGTLATAALYEVLFDMDFDQLELEKVLEGFPQLAQLEKEIYDKLGRNDLSLKAIDETRAKYPSTSQLRDRLSKLKNGGTSLRDRLRTHLPSRTEVEQRLAAVGAPVLPEQIGITVERLKDSYRQAFFIRRRYTVLDFAFEASVFDRAIDKVFINPAAWPCVRT